MKYLTGIYALNIHDESDDTCGDWRGYEARKHPCVSETSTSIFGEEMPRPFAITVYGQECAVATHVRAIFDMLELDAPESLVGFSDDWLCSDDADELVMKNALRLRELNAWPAVKRVLVREYGARWLLLARSAFSGSQTRHATTDWRG